jgi:hypothetical protein
MKKLIAMFTGLMLVTSAYAGGISFSINFGCYTPPVFYSAPICYPAPVCYTPPVCVAPVYYAPAVRVVYSSPVYVAPRPVVYTAPIVINNNHHHNRNRGRTVYPGERP